MRLLPPVKVGHVDGGVTLGGVLLGLAALRDLLLPGKKGSERGSRSQGDILVCTLVSESPQGP